MRSDYPLLDINPVFPGLGKVYLIIIIVVVVVFVVVVVVVIIIILHHIF